MVSRRLKDPLREESYFYAVYNAPKKYNDAYTIPPLRKGKKKKFYNRAHSTKLLNSRFRGKTVRISGLRALKRTGFTNTYATTYADAFLRANKEKIIKLDERIDVRRLRSAVIRRRLSVTHLRRRKMKALKPWKASRYRRNLREPPRGSREYDFRFFLKAQRKVRRRSSSYYNPKGVERRKKRFLRVVQYLKYSKKLEKIIEERKKEIKRRSRPAIARKIFRLRNLKFFYRIIRKQQHRSLRSALGPSTLPTTAKQLFNPLHIGSKKTKQLPINLVRNLFYILRRRKQFSERAYFFQRKGAILLPRLISWRHRTKNFFRSKKLRKYVKSIMIKPKAPKRISRRRGHHKGRPRRPFRRRIRRPTHVVLKITRNNTFLNVGRQGRGRSGLTVFKVTRGLALRYYDKLDSDLDPYIPQRVRKGRHDRANKKERRSIMGKQAFFMMVSEYFSKVRLRGRVNFSFKGRSSLYIARRLYKTFFKSIMNRGFRVNASKGQSFSFRGYIINQKRKLARFHRFYMMLHRNLELLRLFKDNPRGLSFVKKRGGVFRLVRVMREFFQFKRQREVNIAKYSGRLGGAQFRLRYAFRGLAWRFIKRRKKNRTYFRLGKITFRIARPRSLPGGRTKKKRRI